MEVIALFRNTKTGNTFEHIDPHWNISRYDTEEDLKRAMVYQYTEGNYGCDCNRGLFEDGRSEVACGENLYELLELITEDGEKLSLTIVISAGE